MARASEIRLLSTSAILGYGFPEASLAAGMARQPHMIGVDGGSVDPGPHYLGTGTPFCSTMAIRRDLRLMLKAAIGAGIPLMIGTAGGAGGEPHLQLIARLVREIAAEEALHFSLLREHLLTLGHDYGDFDAHAGLWLMTQRTSGDVVARMALVPRTLEARGLDATPPLQDKFARAGDARAVEILGVILRDEIGHVAIGNRWYRWLCERDGLDALTHYQWLAQRYQAPRLRPPFNLDARRAAGFTDEELAALQ